MNFFVYCIRLTRDRLGLGLGLGFAGLVTSLVFLLIYPGSDRSEQISLSNPCNARITV